MPKVFSIDERKETPVEFLARNLRVAAHHLPDPDNKHMNSLRHKGLPIAIEGVYGWQGFLQFMWSWQPVDQRFVSTDNLSGWATDLNQDLRDEDIILKEMEKALFLCHYLSALITNSKISVKWSHLDEGAEKDEFLRESEELKEVLESLDKPSQLKEIQALGNKMRGLLRAMH